MLLLYTTPKAKKIQKRSSYLQFINWPVYSPPKKINYPTNQKCVA